MFKERKSSIAPIFFSLVACASSSMPHAAVALEGNSISNQLTASPDDINQLLSLLEQEQYSLIKRTVATPVFDHIQRDIKKLKNEHGVDFGLTYIPLFEYSDAGHPHDNASAGNFEFFGRYMPKSLQDTKTIFGLKLDDYHDYTTIAPGDFNSQLNSTIRTVSGYLPYNLAVTELWIQQTLISNRLAYRLGKIDMTSIMNSYAFDSRRFYFLSDVFSRHPATAVPSKALGTVVGFALGQHLYTAVGIVDGEGQETNSGFSTVFKGHYFTSFEFGYRDIVTNPRSDNYHVFLWHVDSRPELGKPGGQGLSVVLQKNIHNRLIPFAKLDWSSGMASTFKKLFIAGFGLEHPFNGKFGLIGAASGYAQPSDKPWVNQWVTELFYRVQLTPHSQLTPDVEFIKPIPSNGYHRIETVFNLRYRIAV